MGKKAIKDPKGLVTEDITKDIAGSVFIVPLIILFVIALISALFGLGILGNGSGFLVFVGGLFFFFFFIVLFLKRNAEKVASRISGAAYDSIINKKQTQNDNKTYNN